MVKILLLNWRSLKDPLSGGAELATFEHARRWIKNHKATVVWISPRYNSEIKKEAIGGVSFHYVGVPLNPSANRNILSLAVRFLIFYLSVIYTYFIDYRGRVDVIIDQVHGLPYLTPFYVKERIVVYIHEIAGDIWDKMYTFPINQIGQFIEKFSLKLYSNKNFVVVSQSTKNDIVSLGIPTKNISVVYNGVSIEAQDIMPQKEKQFTITFLNRIVKMKGVERAIKMFALLKKEIPEAIFWVVGRGDVEYVGKLKDLCKDLGILENVKFFGFVTEKEKVNLLTRAHVLVNTSYKEGWGLVNIEANACGTPVVAFNVEGNNESVKDGVSGLLVEDDKLDSMVEALLRIKNDYNTFTSKALEHAKQFNWDERSSEFYKILTQ